MPAMTRSVVLRSGSWATRWPFFGYVYFGA
jgi:hypothetical protein